MKKLKFYLALIALSIILSFAGVPAQAQCAMCRASVEASGDEKLSNLGKGLNKGILYLMVIPYLLAGTVGFLWYRSNRQKNDRNIHA